MGSVVGGLSNYSSSKAQKKAQQEIYREQKQTRQEVKNAYNGAKDTWTATNAPTYAQGAQGNTGFANQLNTSGSSWQNYLQNEAANSLGLGYQKATESIVPQLKGEIAPLIKNYREELMPNARSSAIDAGAYGGARDYLTRERLTENLEEEILNTAARDISDQRAQTASLLGADALAAQQYLNAGTAGNNLLMQSAEQSQYGDSGYLWNLAQQYGNSLGTGIAARSTEQPFWSGVQGALNGFGGFDMGLLSSLFSDERLKTNLKLLGEVDGYKIYRYDYINTAYGQPNSVGVIAQDVEKIMPEAVITGFDGYKRVCYAMLPVGVNKFIKENI